MAAKTQLAKDREAARNRATVKARTELGRRHAVELRALIAHYAQSEPLLQVAPMDPEHAASAQSAVLLDGGVAVERTRTPGQYRVTRDGVVIGMVWRESKARWEADPADEAREPVLRGSRRGAVAYLVGEG